MTVENVLVNTVQVAHVIPLSKIYTLKYLRAVHGKTQCDDKF